MRGDAVITRVSSVHARSEIRRWRWADDNREAISANWQRRIADKPRMFNGRVLLLGDISVAPETLQQHLFRSRLCGSRRLDRYGISGCQRRAMDLPWVRCEVPTAPSSAESWRITRSMPGGSISLREHLIGPTCAADGTVDLAEQPDARTDRGDRASRGRLHRLRRVDRRATLANRRDDAAW